MIKDVVLLRAERLNQDSLVAEGEKLLKASAHWLQHTSASEILEASDNDLVVTAELLRHSDLRTTKGYVHKDLSQLRAALQKRSSH